MKKGMAITKNVRMLLSAVRELTNDNHGRERMALLYGVPGEGKTTSIDYAIDKTYGIALRAKLFWTESSVLSELASELRCPEKIIKSNRKDVKWASVIEHLNNNPCPLFIDEVDRLIMPSNRNNGEKIMELLRDIHDQVKVPVVLVGEENSAINIKENPRFARRISQWVEYKGIDLEDARIVADTICEVSVADDLIEHLYRQSAANIGRIIVGLDAIERHCKAFEVTTLNLAAWGNAELFFDEPTFSRKRGKR
jgi:SpoVK/Ycf46/Vps4 family AAA+-type ATPase